MPTATGEVVINDLEVDINFPRLTLVSMLFPSPDWMIAVNGISFVDENNQWIQNVTIDLFVYDAGTDSGPEYTSPNQVTNPAVDIFSLKSVPPFSDKKIGTLKLRKERNPLNIEKNELKNSINIFYNSNMDNLIINNPNNLKISEVKIYNILGKKIKSEFKNNLISLKGVNKGLYLIKAVTENGNIVKKIIK